MPRRAIFALAAALAAATLAAPAGADTNITDRSTSATTAAPTRRSQAATATRPARSSGGERQQNEPTAAVNPLDVNKMTAGVERLLPGAHDDRRLGRPLLLRRRRGELGQQPAARLPDRHVRGGPGVAALRLHRELGRPRAGLGPHEPPVLRRDRVQPRQADQRLDLGRALQLEPAVRRPGLRVHDDRVPRDADRVRDRALRGQGRARGRRRAEQPARRATSTSAGRASRRPAANNFIEFARSTDGGRTWTTQKISESVHGNQECDIAVTRTGTVFVTWRQYEFKANQGQQQRDAIAWVRSTDGGASFTKPAVAHEFIALGHGRRGREPGRERAGTLRVVPGGRRHARRVRRPGAEAVGP